jgi:hypothetical protein
MEVFKKNIYENKNLIIIFSIAFSIRLVLFLAVEPWKNDVLQERILIMDAEGYYQLAVNLVEHNVFSTEKYAPFMPNSDYLRD